jgi:hypothetical protein
MKWFRMYTDALDDDKLRLVAFEDRWHFVAVLCMKSSGLLDEPPGDLRDRRIAVKLGLTMREAEEVKRRLGEVQLIDGDWQPLAWDRRQYEHDSSAERTRKWRERQRAEAKPEEKQRGDDVRRHGDVTVTDSETETETETEREVDTSTTVGRTRFARPTVEQVAEYIVEINANVDPHKWFDHYTSNGWKVGRNPMKDWKACVRTWARGGQSNGGAGNRSGRDPSEDRSAAGRVRAAVERDRQARA